MVSINPAPNGADLREACDSARVEHWTPTAPDRGSRAFLGPLRHPQRAVGSETRQGFPGSKCGRCGFGESPQGRPLVGLPDLPEVAGHRSPGTNVGAPGGAGSSR